MTLDLSITRQAHDAALALRLKQATTVLQCKPQQDTAHEQACAPMSPPVAGAKVIAKPSPNPDSVSPTSDVAICE